MVVSAEGAKPVKGAKGTEGVKPVKGGEKN